MNDNPTESISGIDHIGPRRIEPVHAPASPPYAAVDTAQDNDLQLDAEPTASMQHPVPPATEDYTISVEHVRDHFRGKGLTKSKDTIQRWCRMGDLDCQKRGVLGRYFTTETSLLELQQKLLPDMIAENSAAAVVQPDAAADDANHTDVRLHATADEPARRGMPSDKADDAAARSDAPVTGVAAPLHDTEELAKLRAENAGLRDQLGEAKENAQFLREEIVSARGQRDDVVKIAEQMLGTLETIAVGGRLERPQRQGSQPDQTANPARFEPQNPAVHDV